jgi:protein-L-isoaspartate(D-aspartate) O-methyltransferase
VELAQKKRNLMDFMKSQGSLKTDRAIKAFEKVNREEFVTPEHQAHSYDDKPLPIGHGQTISQPTTVAIMTEALDVREGSRVLEIGAGSGYQSAILSYLAKEVYTVERIEFLYNYAKEKLKNYKNVKLFLGDGSIGLKEHAPFDRIIITACAPGVPEPLFNQLVDGGKMVLPAGKGFFQNLLIVENVGGKMKSSNLGDFVFVPLIGEFGFEE